MAFEALKVQIAMLLDEIERQPDDPHELQESLREKLSEMRTLGLPLPEDLVELEAALEEGLELPPRRRRGSAGATGAEEA
ncbi:hypothetical protein [Amaricoccus sp.]|uniref:hypothetical protein n=1 Tax=Amaricoccus sp. TaxID=1872485 RepID=UPI001B477D22|nr:hypothetical protein [Amaricoccus sp.]MBP7242782.1 hypothetical protein [Amaricoccus sp.]